MPTTTVSTARIRALLDGTRFRPIPYAILHKSFNLRASMCLSRADSSQPFRPLAAVKYEPPIDVWLKLSLLLLTFKKARFQLATAGATTRSHLAHLQSGKWNTWKIQNIIKPYQLDNLSAVDLCFTTSRCGGTMASWPRLWRHGMV